MRLAREARAAQLEQLVILEARNNEEAKRIFEEGERIRGEVAKLLNEEDADQEIQEAIRVSRKRADLLNEAIGIEGEHSISEQDM
jgi:hypothetical protein